MASRGREPLKVLVLDDDREAIAPLVAELEAVGHRVHHAASVAEAIEQLADLPELLVTEACLRRGAAQEVLRRARRLKVPPVMIAISDHADRELVARLVQEGVDAYAEKPASGQTIERIFDQCADPERLCRRMARLLVGRLGLKEAIGTLRGTMNTEALRRTGLSRRAAAKMLDVDRRYVQRMVEEYGEPDGPDSGSFSIVF